MEASRGLGQSETAVVQDALEEQAEETARQLLDVLVGAAERLWPWGDGHGAYLHRMLDEAAWRAGLPLSSARERTGPRKAPIPAPLRWQVWQRDNFTCQECGVRADLTVDHVIAEINGGTLELANLQTLCRPCNSKKGTR